MSYEPTLIIRYDDLGQVDFDSMEYDPKFSKFFAAADTQRMPGEYMQVFLRERPKVHIIGKIPIVLCQPEGTTFNNRVRAMLKELNVRFWEDY